MKPSNILRNRKLLTNHKQIDYVRLSLSNVPFWNANTLRTQGKIYFLKTLQSFRLRHRYFECNVHTVFKVKLQAVVFS